MYLALGNITKEKDFNSNNIYGIYQNCMDFLVFAKKWVQNVIKCDILFIVFVYANIYFETGIFLKSQKIGLF